jgi:CRP-like cAMP-binding protein
MLHSPSQNRLLAALPAAELARLEPGLELVHLRVGEIIYRPGERQEFGYFPTSAIISLHYVMASGSTAEVAGVGNDGLVGLALLLGGETTSSSATVPIAGHGYRLEQKILKREFLASEHLQSLVLGYLRDLIADVGQKAACNRHHSIDQQLCGWLLLTLDRTANGELVITQDLVAGMLGVRRESITMAVRKLQDAGLIRCRRGHISVLHRAGLETLACECYAAVKKQTGRHTPDTRDAAPSYPLLRDAAPSYPR